MILVEQKPQWVPIIEMVLKDSVGFTLVSEIPDLSVRLRPETTFNQPLKTLWPINKALLAELQNTGISIVSEILFLPDDQLSSFAGKFRVRERLKEYLEGLRLTPHARVLEAAFGEKQHPVPPERESELVSAVGEQVATLPEREQTVLGLRFGLDDGITRTLEEIGSPKYMKPRVRRQMILAIKDKALRRLQFPFRRKDLIGYFSLPEESLGREFLGAAFMKDLPKFSYVSVRSLDLSNATKKEMANISIDSLGDLVKTHLRDITLSQKARGELGNELKKVADKYYRQQEEEERWRKEEEQRKELERQRSVAEWESRSRVNNLLPEIILSSEQVELLRDTRLSELGLPSHVYNSLERELMEKMPIVIKYSVLRETTVAELLNLSREDLVDIRGLGAVGIIKLAEKLGDKLEQLFGQEGIKSQVSSIFERQIARQTVEGKNKAEIFFMRDKIKEATEQGFNSTEEIHNWLILKKERIFNIKPDSWIVKSMIEYVLNHPEIEA